MENHWWLLVLFSNNWWLHFQTIIFCSIPPFLLKTTSGFIHKPSVVSFPSYSWFHFETTFCFISKQPLVSFPSRRWFHGSCSFEFFKINILSILHLCWINDYPESICRSMLFHIWSNTTIDDIDSYRSMFSPGSFFRIYIDSILIITERGSKILTQYWFYNKWWNQYRITYWSMVPMINIDSIVTQHWLNWSIDTYFRNCWSILKHIQSILIEALKISIDRRMLNGSKNLSVSTIDHYWSMVSILFSKLCTFASINVDIYDQCRFWLSTMISIDHRWSSIIYCNIDLLWFLP